MINEFDQNLDDYAAAEELSSIDFTDVDANSFGSVETVGNTQFGRIGNQYVNLGPVRVEQEPEPPQETQTQVAGLGDLEVALNAPFAAIPYGILLAVKNIGSLAGFENEKVNLFFERRQKFTDSLTKNNLPAQTGEAIGRIGGQLLAPVGLLYKAFRSIGASPVTATVAAEPIAGFVAMTPEDESMFNLISKDTDSEAAKALRNLLATDVDDTQYENRARHAVEALLFLGGAEATVRTTIGGIKAAKQFLKTDEGQIIENLPNTIGTDLDKKIDKKYMPVEQPASN